MVKVDALGMWLLGMLSRELECYSDKLVTADLNMMKCLNAWHVIFFSGRKEPELLDEIGFWSDERASARKRIRLLKQAKRELGELLREN